MVLVKKIMRFKLLFILLILIFGSTIKAQFISPILHELKFTGSYGELRPNHFHNGIDLKIDRSLKNNYTVAVMDGIIRRISVEPDNYGKLLVIDHPNGYSSLYAHLERFSEDIDQFVRSYQLSNRTFEVDLNDLSIPVVQGQIIGIIGNSGSSQGPHLHFEILNTLTNYSYNPKLFGIDVMDFTPPVIQKIKISGVDKEYNQLNSKIFNVKKIRSDSFAVQDDTIRYGSKLVALAFLGYDQISGTTNRNGIYKSTLKLDGDTVFSYVFNNISSMHYTNYKAHIDQREYLNSGVKYHRLHVLPGNDLDIYTTRSDDALIELDTVNARNIEIITEDFDKNKSVLKFKIMMDKDSLKLNKYIYNHIIPHGNRYQIETNGYKLSIPENSFFKTTYMNVTVTDSSGFSPSVKISTNREAFKKEIEISLKPFSYNRYIDKMSLVRIDNGKRKNIGGIFRDGFFVAKINEEGTYKILVDTIKPTIRPVNIKSSMKKTDRMIFAIRDNFSSGLTVPHLKVDAYLDDEWILFDYDKKYNSITHIFNKNLPAGKHFLKLFVTDTRGNVAEYTKTFIK